MEAHNVGVARAISLHKWHILRNNIGAQQGSGRGVSDMQSRKISDETSTGNFAIGSRMELSSD
jgi:hypothetical protein